MLKLITGNDVPYFDGELMDMNNFIGIMKLLQMRIYRKFLI